MTLFSLHLHVVTNWGDRRSVVPKTRMRLIDVVVETNEKHDCEKDFFNSFTFLP